MFCNSCGKEIADGSVFCPACGTNLKSLNSQKSQEVKTIKLRCKDCNGLMEVDPDTQQMNCPYCGSKEIIVDSDAVSIEKIRNKTYKEIELEKMKNENEKEANRENKEETEKYRKSKFSIVCIVFTVICLLFMFVAFGSKHILAGIIALIQVGLFSASWLMGMKLIKEKKRGLHIALAVLAFVLIVPFFMATTIKQNKLEKLDWPTTGIATNIPEPDIKYGEIDINSDEEFRASLEKVSQSDYDKYVEECKNMGYTIDSSSNTHGYTAFNEEGYKLNINFYDSMEDMDIYLYAPMDAKEFKWPRSEIAKLIPQPKSNIGKIEWEHDYGFVIYVANTTQDEFEDYVEQCEDAGFIVDYSKGDTHYYADNADGYHLSLKYEGNNIMFVRMDEPDEEETAEASTESNEEVETSTEGTNVKEEEEQEEKVEENNEQNTEVAEENQVVEETPVVDETKPESTEETTTELVDGMRPEFKEAMDSYEAFFDEYCEFLNSLNENPSDLTILAQYAVMVEKEIEMSAKFDAWDDGALNDAELKYYLEVQNRVNQKLLSVAY